jgi:hypothetical protein
MIEAVPVRQYIIHYARLENRKKIVRSPTTNKQAYLCTFIDAPVCVLDM